MDENTVNWMTELEDQNSSDARTGAAPARLLIYPLFDHSFTHSFTHRLTHRLLF